MVLYCYSEGDIVGDGSSCVEATICIIHLDGDDGFSRGDIVSFDPFSIDC